LTYSWQRVIYFLEGLGFGTLCALSPFGVKPEIRGLEVIPFSGCRQALFFKAFAGLSLSLNWLLGAKIPEGFLILATIYSKTAPL